MRNCEVVVSSIYFDLPLFYGATLYSVVESYCKCDPNVPIGRFLALWASKYCLNGELNIKKLIRLIRRTDNPIVFLPLEIQLCHGTCYPCPLHNFTKPIEHIHNGIRQMLCASCIRGVAKGICDDGLLPKWYYPKASELEFSTIEKVRELLPDPSPLAVAAATLSAIRDIEPEKVIYL